MYRLLVFTLLGWLVAASALVGAGTNAAAPDRSDAAWAAIRARFPADQPLPRPTWLPDRFTRPGQAIDNGLLFGVLYTSDEGDTILFGGAPPIPAPCLPGTSRRPSSRSSSRV